MKAQKKNQVQQEDNIVEVMNLANAIATKVFGTTKDTFGVFEIYDYLQINDDSDDFEKDLQRIYAHAQKAFETVSPTPEEVFGLFDLIYDNK